MCYKKSDRVIKLENQLEILNNILKHYSKKRNYVKCFEISCEIAEIEDKLQNVKNFERTLRINRIGSTDKFYG